MDLFQKLAMMGSDILTGQRGSGISPEQQRAATGQGLTAAGLQTILGSQPGAGPGGASPTALGAIAQGALAGQAAGGAARAGARQQNALGAADFSTPEGIRAAIQSGMLSPEMADQLRGLVEFEAEQAAPPELERIDTGNAIIFRNVHTGEVVDTVFKDPDIQANPEIGRRADAYFRQTLDHAERASSAATARAQFSLGTGVGDLLGITAMMKIADPTSSVREGEFENAFRTAGLSDRLIALAKNMDAGDLLSPSQRAEMIGGINVLVAQQRPFLTALMDRERRIAGALRIDPEIYVEDFYATLASLGPTGAPFVPPEAASTAGGGTDLFPERNSAGVVAPSKRVQRKED